MMTYLRRLGGLAFLAALLAVLPPASAQVPDVPTYDGREPPGPPPAVPDEGPATPALPEGAEVQARGPVHEAFAQPTDVTPAPGPVVPKQPPDPVPEAPPDEKPEGSVWIPGYWGWDDDRSDFLWVSGFWRVPPPGRKWVPGYWNQVEGGWQWVSGFWANVKQESLPYMDEPPASLERGPSQPAPDDDSIYVPGCWVVRSLRYLWRPGFWCPARPGWVYCPPRYNWTPSGTLFVDGYWDYGLEDRGVLFAPVYFSRPLWETPGWAFQPTYTVGYPSLLGALWVRPRWGWYSFGDYYGSRYARLGYRPWVTYGARYHDPLFDYYRWSHRSNPGWYSGLVSTYRGRVRGDLPLPPRTLAAQQRLLAGGRLSRGAAQSLRVVRPLSQLRSPSLRLTRVTAADRSRRANFVTAYHRAAAERRTLERSRVARDTRRALPLARVPSPSAGVRAEALRPSRGPGPGRVTAPGRGTPPARPRLGPAARTPRAPLPGRETRRPFGPATRPGGPTTPPGGPRRVAGPESRPRTPGLPPRRTGPASRPTLPIPRPSERRLTPRPTPTARPTTTRGVRTTPRPTPNRPGPAGPRTAPRPAPRPTPAARPRPGPAGPRATPRPTPPTAPRPAPRPATRTPPRSAPRPAGARPAPRPAARPPARSAPARKPAPHKPAPKR
jgi:hypothetical protein